MQAATPKIYYIDNLRILLTTLVILHHTCIAYGAPGGWYYTDKTTNEAALIAMTLFVATNQAFFMGFFFFLSALFTEPSYEKKGAAKFVADRLKRLGIPLLFYSFVLSPLLNFLIYRFGYHKPATLWQYLQGYDDWVDPGVMWFVAALLLFTLVYVGVRHWFSGADKKHYPLPGNNAILLFALLLGSISFTVRIVFPVGWVWHPWGFQLAHFTQYIALFIIGIVASRNQWLGNINLNLKTGKRWLVIAFVLVVVLFPCLYAIKTVTNSSLSAFEGRGSWQSLLSAVWEQLTGIAIIMALLGIAKAKGNKTNPLLQRLSRSAYATYIFHPLIVVSVCLLLTPWQVDPVIKFLIAAPVAVMASFCLAQLLLTIPVVKDIV